MMNARGYWSTFFTIFAFTAIPMALLSRAFLDSSVDESIFSGIFFGVFFGLVMAFFARGETLKLQYDNQQEFAGKLRIFLAENGYHPESTQGDYLIFNSQSGTIKMGPIELGQPKQFKIFVQLSSNEATVVGPKMMLGKLKGRFSR